MTDTIAAPTTPSWALRVAFARHFGEARTALAALAPPDPGNRAEVLTYAQTHALVAIAAALDPDSAALVSEFLHTDEEEIATTTP
jgi:hypothetical protein